MLTSWLYNFLVYFYMNLIISSFTFWAACVASANIVKCMFIINLYLFWFQLPVALMDCAIGWYHRQPQSLPPSQTSTNLHPHHRAAISHRSAVSTLLCDSHSSQPVQRFFNLRTSSLSRFNRPFGRSSNFHGNLANARVWSAWWVASSDCTGADGFVPVAVAQRNCSRNRKAKNDVFVSTYW